MKRAVLALALLLVACGDRAPSTGKVVDKRFDPEHWESGYRTDYVPQYRCRAVSRYDYDADQYVTTQECGTETEAVQVWEEQHEHVPDRWYLKLEKCPPESSKKCKTGWRRVSETRYEALGIGDFYEGEK